MRKNNNTQNWGGASPEGQSRPTQAGINEVSEDVVGSLKRLESQYPPDGVLVMNISAALMQADRTPSFVKNNYVKIATDLMRKLLDDKLTAHNFLNLGVSLSNIASFAQSREKNVVGSDVLYKTISDAYEVYLANQYFVRGAERSTFLQMAVLLLSNITIADGPVEKILKVPHLCEIGVNSIFRANDREAACNFIGNISYDNLGKNKLKKCRMEFWEALVDFLPSLNPPDRIYLSISNVYEVADESFRAELIKTIIKKGFLKHAARHIREMHVETIGTFMNFILHGPNVELFVDKEILEALATCAIQCKDQEILDLIANILHGFSLEKKVDKKLITMNAGPTIEKFSKVPHKSIMENSKILLTKIYVQTGETEVFGMKCSNVPCKVHSEKLLKCAACGSVGYCSKECQKADWKAGHKQSCAELKKLSDSEGKLSSKQGNIERTIAFKYMNEHLMEFSQEAAKKGTILTQCVVVIDFTKGREKFTVYPIPEFYSTIIKSKEFSQGVDFPRMRESHASHKGPAFIVAIIQTHTIASYVIPLA